MAEPQIVYRFGGHRLDPATRTLHGTDGEPIHLAQKPFLVLLHLIEQRPRLVARGELLDRYWGGKDVYDQALTRCMSSVRKALDDTSDPPRFIETRWAEGYRFIGAIEDAPPPSVAAPPEAEGADAPAAPAGHGICWRCVFSGAAAVALLAAVGVGLRPPAPSSELNRIAVLPVRATAPDDWISIGLTDRLVASLSKIEGVTILAPKADQLDALRARSRVDAVLESKAVLDASSVRLEATLSAADDRSVLWTFETEHPRADMMLAEREIAIALASRLTARLRRTDAPPQSATAYAHYLRGRHLWRQRTPSALQQAVAAYEDALASDPAYAAAHSGLAETLLMLPQYASRPPIETRARARAAAETALRLDPEIARAHLVLGVIAQHGWDWNEADAHFASALRLDPNDATAQQWRAESLCFRRRFAECRAGLAEAQRIDPLSPVIAMVGGIARRWSGDHAGAIAEFELVSKRWPEFRFVEIERAKALVASGDPAAAILRYEAALPTYGVAVVGGPLAFAYARAGRRADAKAMRDALLAYGGEHYISPVSVAIAALGLGERDAALALLERAVAEQDGLAIYIGVDEHFEGLRAEPRFQALLVRAGLATGERRPGAPPVRTGS